MKKVLITGGTGALGYELIKQFSSKNYSIVFSYAHSQKRAQEICKEFKNTKAIQIIDSDVKEVENNFDIVINSAAYGGYGDLTHSVEDILMLKAFEVNVMLPFKISKLVLPYMMNKKWGRIINVSSRFGLKAGEYTVAYNTSKFALNGLTRTIAREYAINNITCNSVCPAAIGDDGMAIKAAKFYSKDQKEYDEEIKAYEQATPIKRMAKVEEITNVILFLASNESSYVNGVNLPVDGGGLA